MYSYGRQEFLSKRWPRKVGKIKRGLRRQLLSRRRLGSETVEVLGLLGEGASAAVFSCRVAESQQYLAVKIEREVFKREPYDAIYGLK